MPEMTESEYREFLLEGTKTGKLGTVMKDGRPHLVPVWYDLDGGDLVFATGGETVKSRNMKRDTRICISVDDQTPPYSFVMIEGTVSFSEDPEELLKWATCIGGRYMGENRADAYGRRNSSEGEILVRIRTEKILAYKDVTAW